ADHLQEPAPGGGRTGPHPDRGGGRHPLRLRDRPRRRRGVVRRGGLARRPDPAGGRPHHPWRARAGRDRRRRLPRPRGPGGHGARQPRLARRPPRRAGGRARGGRPGGPGARPSHRHGGRRRRRHRRHQGLRRRLLRLAHPRLRRAASPPGLRLRHAGGRGPRRRPARRRAVPVPGRPAPLRADLRDARGRAQRHLDLPGHRPAGGPDHRAHARSGAARPRPRRHLRGSHRRDPRPQRRRPADGRELLGARDHRSGARAQRGPL
ncbi:MAG: hypothetical protein AVDCRST_MAG65-759, partial [uncultured Solirubrobacteraceae bacterium]